MASVKKLVFATLRATCYIAEGIMGQKVQNAITVEDLEKYSLDPRMVEGKWRFMLGLTLKIIANYVKVYQEHSSLI